MKFDTFWRLAIVENRGVVEILNQIFMVLFQDFIHCAHRLKFTNWLYRRAQILKIMDSQNLYNGAED